MTNPYKNVSLSYWQQSMVFYGCCYFRIACYILIMYYTKYTKSYYRFYMDVNKIIPIVMIYSVH